MTNDLIGQWLGKYCILGWNWAKRGAAKQVWFVPNTVGGSGVRCNVRKILQFFPSFKLGISSSSTLTDTELLCKYEHFSYLKNSNLTINWVTSLFHKHTLPERLSSQSNKMKSMGLQKSQFLNFLVSWE